jgi:hypothetical protein
MRALPGLRPESLLVLRDAPDSGNCPKTPTGDETQLEELVSGRLTGGSAIAKPPEPGYWKETEN